MSERAGAHVIRGLPLTEFGFQVSVWGYAVCGCDVPNTVAAIAEQGHAWGAQVWDRTAADLEGSLRSVDGGDYERVPDVWALPAVMELAMRSHLT